MGQADLAQLSALVAAGGQPHLGTGSRSLEHLTPTRGQLEEIRGLAAGLQQDVRNVHQQVRAARAEVGPLIAFVHIPKTAGGTTTLMLENAYSPAALHNAGNYFRSPEISEAKITRGPGGWEQWRRRGGRFTVGHLPYGLFRRRLPADTRYITLLRDPIERVLSQYYGHIQREGTVRDHRKPVVADSLEQALADLPQLDNLATRLLCGDAHPMGALAQAALRDAKANLGEFAFVGIQERFPESMLLLQRMLGLQPVIYENRHVTVDRPTAADITDEQRALILGHNDLDVELYSFGRHVFEAAVNEADPALAKEAEELHEKSTVLNADALRAAREWLDQHLPVGRRAPQTTMREVATADGVSPAALKHLSKLLIEKDLDDADEVVWVRRPS